MFYEGRPSELTSTSEGREERGGRKMGERREAIELTDFWAVKMQFMMGTYCPLASGVTESTTIRGFAFRAGPVAAEEVEPKERSEVLDSRLMSRWVEAGELGEEKTCDKVNVRHKAIDKAPTRFTPPSTSSGNSAIISLTPFASWSSTIRNCW
jgi:hypothetical protein